MGQLCYFLNLILLMFCDIKSVATDENDLSDCLSLSLHIPPSLLLIYGQCVLVSLLTVYRGEGGGAVDIAMPYYRTNVLPGAGSAKLIYRAAKEKLM